jgi:formylglycine-generating enzyme
LNDALAFCKWASEKTGENIRLPSETEWEYVIRGGNKSKGYTYSGSNNLDEVAWFSSNSGSKTHEVGKKQPNETGLYDMNGNVTEWCGDWYDAKYYTNSPSNNPMGATSGDSRVARGGMFNSNGFHCSVAGRYTYFPDRRHNNLGFRVVQEMK